MSQPSHSLANIKNTYLTDNTIAGCAFYYNYGCCSVCACNLRTSANNFADNVKLIIPLIHVSTEHGAVFDRFTAISKCNQCKISTV